MQLIWTRSQKGWLILFFFSGWPFANFIGVNHTQDTDYLGLASVWLFALGTASFASWFCNRVMFKKPDHRVPIVAGFLITVFFAYDLATTIVNMAGGWWGVYYLIGWSLGLVFAMLWAIFACRRDRLLDVTVVGGSVLIIASSSPFILGAINDLSSSRQLTSSTSNSLPHVNGNERGSGNYHAVFFVVMDAYAGQEPMLSEYGFDNSEFVAELRSKGFHVFRNGRSNYTSTTLSLGTSLSMDYILSGIKDVNEAELIARNALIANPFRDTLVKLGYNYFWAGHKGHVRVQCAPNCILGEANVTPTLFELMKMTPVFEILNMISRDILLKFGWYLMKSVDPVIKAIDYMGTDKVFLFAHILSPHEPNIYNSDCSRRDDFNFKMDTSNDPHANVERARSSYVAEVKCLNSKLLQLWSKIDERFTDPIVLFQSDHGSQLPNTEFDISERLRLQNFSAVKLPKRCAEYIYDGMTNINVARLVLSCAIGEKPSFLADRLFIKDRQRKLVEIESVQSF